MTEMPLWVPADDAGLLQVNVGKALQAGQSFQPLPDTVRDTLNWLETRSAEYQWRGGLSAKREKELLLQWQTSP